MTDSTDSPWLDARGTAKRIGVCVRTLENHVKSGRFPAPVKLARRRLWHKEVLARWEREQAEQAHLENE